MPRKTALIVYYPARREAHVKETRTGDVLHATQGQTYQEAIGYAVNWALDQGGFARVTTEEA